MRKVAILTTPDADAAGPRKALRLLRLHEVSSVHDADAVIVAGAPAEHILLLHEKIRAGTPVLCQPTPQPPAGATLASHLRFIPGALRARQLLQAGMLGTDVRFTARSGTTALDWARTLACWDKKVTGGGVLLQPGADLLDLLCWWLGPLAVEETASDGTGGVEAEFHGRYRSSNASGTLLLSRLRNLGGSISIRGSAGEIGVDLAELKLSTDIPALRDELRTAKALPLAILHRQRVASWLQMIDADPSMLADSGAHELMRQSYLHCRRLRHPWELQDMRDFASLRGRRVLVTGATGFIGARLTERLACAGADVTVAIRSAQRAARIARLGVRMVLADLCTYDATRRAADGCEIAFNLAHDFDSTGRSNVEAARTLADACRDAGISRIIQTSSIATCDDWPASNLDEESPASQTGHSYKRTKVAIDAELRDRARRGDFTVAILKPTIVYGPFSRFWTDGLAERMRAGPTVLPASLDGLCNGVHVDDVVDAMLAAALAPIATSEVFIVSGPEPFPWRRLIESYAQALDCQLIVEPGRALHTEAADARPANSPTSRISPASMLQAVLRVAVPAARRLLGSSRFDRMRAHVQQLQRRRNSTFRPIDSNPLLYHAQGICSVEKISRLLLTPRVSPETGLQLTQTYLKWRYGQ